jgi:hypothetical protein
VVAATRPEREGFGLCFVDALSPGGSAIWACFSDIDPGEVTGVGWELAPHIHAKVPKTSPARQRITSTGFHIAFNLVTQDSEGNDLSAREMNRRGAPWISGRLTAPRPLEIFAGERLEDFRRVVRELGGQTFELDVSE